VRSQPDRPKSERFAEFLRRLGSAPAAATFSEAYEQLGVVLNEVEDSMTSIPFNPELWQTDGRMYPPQADSIREVEGQPKVKRFRSLRHNTYLGENGALGISSAPEGEVVLAKPGADGKGVWEQ
jgi:hypothetical protein